MGRLAPACWLDVPIHALSSRSFAALGLIAVLSAPAAAAATAAPATETVSLREAIARGLEAHPGLRAARHLIEAARARETQAQAAPNPNLSFAIDQVPFGSPGAGNYMAGVSQPLLPGALREARIGIARVDREIAELGLAIARLDLAWRVKAAYARALYEGEGLRLALDTAEHARWLARATAARWKAGDVARVALLRAEVDVARAERTVREAEGAIAQARARLNVLLGREAQADLALRPLPPPRAVALPPLAALVARALAGRTEFRRADLVVRREAMQRQAALAGLWTGTEIAASLGAVAGQPGFSTTLALPLPLYRQQGEAAEAEADRLRAEAERDALRHEVTLEVEQAWREARLAADLADRYARDYRPQAERFAVNARARFRAGEGDGVEVAEAEHTLHEVHTQHRRVVLDWHEAVSRLERAVGAERAELEGAT